MAEIIGIIAAAAQLVELATKIRRLCSDVRNISNDLSQLLDEIVVLTDLMADARFMTIPEGVSLEANTGWVKCHSLFVVSVDRVVRLVTDLEVLRKHHTRTKSLRLYFRKGDLIRAKEQLEQAKSTMNLALQSYSLSVLSQQNAMLLRKIQSVVAQQSLMNKQDTTEMLVKSTSGHTQSQNPDSNGTQALITTLKTLPPEKTQDSQGRLLNVHLPPWLFRKGVRILCDFSSNHISMSVRMYNIVSTKSQVFVAAREGKWDTVRLLFEQGQASPFDIDQFGRTLLHFAAQHANPTACKLLLSYNVDVSQRTSSKNHQPIHEILVARIRHERSGCPPMDDIEETMWLLIEASPDHFELGRIHKGDDRMWLLASPPKVMSKLRAASFRPYETLDPYVRAQNAMWRLLDLSDLVQPMLGSDMNLEQAFHLLVSKKSKSNHLELLSSAVKTQRYASLVRGTDDGRRTVLASVVRFESKNSKFVYFTSSLWPFVQYYLGHQPRHTFTYTSDWNAQITSAGRVWLRILKKAGVRLERYGRAERQSITTYLAQMYWPKTEKRRRDLVCRVKHIIYGPEVESWNIFVVPCFGTRNLSQRFYNTRVPKGHAEYEMAGEFWDWVENPELYKVPGAYIHEGGVDESLDRRAVWMKGPLL